MAADNKNQQNIMNSITRLWEAAERERGGEEDTQAEEKTVQNNSSRRRGFFEVTAD